MSSFDPNASPYVSPQPIEPGAVRSSSKATWSLVCGIMSLVCCFVAGIPGMILGVQAQREIDQSGGRLTGRGIATAGVVTSAIGTLLIGAFAVIGILIALLLPAVQAAREAARRSNCKNNLRQLALALYNYHDTHGSLPPAVVLDEAGEPMHSWRALILPYLEGEAELAGKYRFDEPWNGPNNSALHASAPKCMLCPSEPGLDEASASYFAVVGSETAWPGAKSVRFKDIVDGTANTILLVESANSGVNWLEPIDIDLESSSLVVNGSELQSHHPGGINVAFADTSVQFVANTANPNLLHSMFTIAGHDLVSGAAPSGEAVSPP